MTETFEQIQEQSAAAAKLLAHPARIKIIDLLSEHPALLPGELVAQLPLSRGSVNQHLTALKEAGWITTSLNGAHTIQYTLNTQKVQEELEPLRVSLERMLSHKPHPVSQNSTTKRVLFLCTGNSCRSQMAEGFFNHYAAHIPWSAESAGTVPSQEIHPLAIEVMKERNIDITHQFPKSSKEFLGKKTIQMVIFVCSEAEKDCPYLFPFAKRKIKMPFPDPAAFEGTPEETIETFRTIRDQIESKIKLLVEELTLGENDE